MVRAHIGGGAAAGGIGLMRKAIPRCDMPPLHPVTEDDKISLEVALELAFPCSRLSTRKKWNDRKITNFLMFVGPKTLLRPPVAVNLAYPDGAMDEGHVWRAIRDRKIDYYDIDDKKYITLTDLSDLAAQQNAAGKIGSIYFAGFRSRVKIGFTLGPIANRLKSLQTACPARIELYASLWGTQACERVLHRRFSRSRLSGEWFKRTSSLSAFIAQVQETDWRRRFPSS
jgi:Meiotically up-regulated gene 113